MRASGPQIPGWRSYWLESIEHCCCIVDILIISHELTVHNSVYIRASSFCYNWLLKKVTVTAPLCVLSSIDVSPPNFVPFVDYKERAQQWRWIGAGRDSDDNMAALFKHFITNRKEGNCDLYEGGPSSTPPPRR